jgi:hypothetical protein
VKTKTIYLVVDHSRDGISSQIINAFECAEDAKNYLVGYVSATYTTPLHENPKTHQEFLENYYRSGGYVRIETCIMYVKD